MTATGFIERLPDWVQDLKLDKFGDVAVRDIPSLLRRRCPQSGKTAEACRDPESEKRDDQVNALTVDAVTTVASAVGKPLVKELGKSSADFIIELIKQFVISSADDVAKQVSVVGKATKVGAIAGAFGITVDMAVFVFQLVRAVRRYKSGRMSWREFWRFTTKITTEMIFSGAGTLASAIVCTILGSILGGPLGFLAGLGAGLGIGLLSLCAGKLFSYGTEGMCDRCIDWVWGPEERLITDGDDPAPNT